MTVITSIFRNFVEEKYLSLFLNEIFPDKDPVNTRRYLDVHSTSSERYGCQMDVETTLFAYWGRLYGILDKLKPAAIGGNFRLRFHSQNCYHFGFYVPKTLFSGCMIFVIISNVDRLWTFECIVRGGSSNQGRIFTSLTACDVPKSCQIALNHSNSWRFWS